MNFREQTNLYLRLKRLLNPKLMGDLFKVILAYNFKKINLPDLTSVLFNKYKKI